MTNVLRSLEKAVRHFCTKVYLYAFHYIYTSGIYTFRLLLAAVHKVWWVKKEGHIEGRYKHVGRQGFR